MKIDQLGILLSGALLPSAPQTLTSAPLPESQTSMNRLRVLLFGLEKVTTFFFSLIFSSHRL